MEEDKHQIKPFPLRLDEQLREALQKVADKSKRSLNAEITGRLEQSLLNDEITESTKEQIFREIEELRRELTKVNKRLDTQHNENKG